MIRVATKWTAACLLVLSITVVRDADHAWGVAQVRGQRVQFSEAWFDRTCFGQLTAAMARRRCHELLDKRVELATEIADLDEDQIRKLRAAGATDIHRYFAEYSELKRQFDFGVISANQWEDRYQTVLSESRPLVNRIENGLHGPHSLYRKTLAATVEPSAADEIQQSYRQYAQSRFATKIDQTLRQVLRNGVDRQSSEDPNLTMGGHVTQVLLDSTEPPEFYGNSRNYINTVVAKLMSVEDQVGDLLSENELTLLRELYHQQHPSNRKPLAASPRR